MITDEAGARRLANAIVSDAALYGGESALSDPKTLDEVHELFFSKCDRSLHHVLVTALEDARRGAAGGTASTGVEVVAGAGGSAVAISLAIGLLVLCAGAAFFLAAR